MKNIGKMIPVLAPVFAVGTVAWGAASSLSGYTAPVYGAERFKIAVDAAQENIQGDPQQDIQKKDRKAAPQEDGRGQNEQKAQESQKTGAFQQADGTYKGSAQGFAGPITVGVQIKDHSLTAVNVLESKDDAAFLERAKAVIDSMIREQDLEVDTVSGATYSSKGIIQAAKNALSVQPGGTGSGTGTAVPSSSGSAPVTIGQGNFNVADGTYNGSAQGYHGAVNVSVRIQDKTIRSIDVVSHSDDESFFTKAKDGVVGSILSFQSLEVDTVSGATYSSTGIINAVRDALDKAKISDPEPGKPSVTPSPTQAPAPVGAFPYPDGTYTGTGEGFGGDIVVSVTICDKSIKEIKIISHEGEDAVFFDRAKSVAEQVAKKQSVKVDAVSGATYSSQGILEGIMHALKKAEKTAAGTTEKPQPTDTPRPTDTLQPTDMPQPTDTPQPTDMPQLTDTPQPTDMPQPSPGMDDVPAYIDGSYTVTVPCTPDEYGDFDLYDLTLTLAIKDGKIIAVSGISGDGGPENAQYIKRAAQGSSKYTGVVAQILEKNSVEDVDTVSHATCSSASILEACRQALTMAERK